MHNEKNSLEYIKELVTQNNNAKALEILNHLANKSMWFQNTKAVCQMRMNASASAVRTLQPVVFIGGSVTINPETPDKIKLNLAEAMLLSGNVAGAVNILEYCSQKSPARDKLENAIKKWKQSLPIWPRLMILLGGLPIDKPVNTDAPYGEL